VAKMVHVNNKNILRQRGSRSTSTSADWVEEILESLVHSPQAPLC